MNFNIENRTDKTFISTPSKFRNLYMYSRNTSNFQLPYFLTFYIDAHSVSNSKANVVINFILLIITLVKTTILMSWFKGLCYVNQTTDDSA